MTWFLNEPKGPIHEVARAIAPTCDRELRVIVTGDPVHGFAIHGPPFEELTDEIADNYEGDWWVVPYFAELVRE